MKVLNIYIDGSHLDKQHNGRLGVGGILVDDTKKNVIDAFSEELTQDYMGKAFGAIKCSNPSAELTALLKALQNFKKHLKTASEIVVRADYVGVREWMTGAWKIKEPYIARIKQEIDKEITRQGLDSRIRYEWVKGHQSKSVLDPDAYWNNQVDLLAKGQEDTGDE